MSALGFIETYALLPAIEAADAMLKAADVRLVEKSLAGGGLVTITVAGEVAAVKAAVDAGTAAVARIQGAKLVSRHVIARPDGELSNIFDAKKAAKNEDKKTVTPVAEEKPAAPVAQKAEAAPADSATQTAPRAENAPAGRPQPPRASKKKTGKKK